MAALVTACTSQQLPRVTVHLAYDRTIDPTVADFAWHGADAWEPVGVDAAPPDAHDDLPACAERWWTDGPDPCQVTLRAEFWPASTLPPGVVGMAELPQRVIVLSDELQGFALESVVAHEVGHSVFSCGDHLLSGEAGIMSAASTGAVVPSAADLRWVSRCTDGAVTRDSVTPRPGALHAAQTPGPGRPGAGRPDTLSVTRLGVRDVVPDRGA